MKNSKSDLALMLFFVFLILGGILLTYGLMQPTVYEKEAASLVQEQNVATINPTTNNQAVAYPININTATAEELMQIKGIGPNRAYAIIDYREHLGGYSSIEQIKQIKGISDSIYNDIAGYLTV